MDLLQNSVKMTNQTRSIYHEETDLICFKVARYSFSGLIPPKFEHKLRRQKQSFGKIAITVVLDKDENLL